MERTKTQMLVLAGRQQLIESHAVNARKRLHRFARFQTRLQIKHCWRIAVRCSAVTAAIQAEDIISRFCAYPPLSARAWHVHYNSWVGARATKDGTVPQGRVRVPPPAEAPPRGTAGGSAAGAVSEGARRSPPARSSGWGLCSWRRWRSRAGRPCRRPGTRIPLRPVQIASRCSAAPPPAPEVIVCRCVWGN